MNYSSSAIIQTVAIRELKKAFYSKGLMLSIAVVIIIMIGAIFLAQWAAQRESPNSIAVVTTSSDDFWSRYSNGLKIVQTKSASDAIRMVEANETELALDIKDNDWILYSKGQINTSMQENIGALVQLYSMDRAVKAVGIESEEFYQNLASPNIEFQDITANNSISKQSIDSIVTVLGGIMILMFSIMLFAANIGGRVTEEKSSRIIEIILGSVRPLDFLTGKILGNTLFGLGAVSVILAIGIVGLRLSGLHGKMTIEFSILPALIIAFILGICFFGSLYAAAGAMVQRTEDLQSTQMPIVFLLAATIYTPLFGYQYMDETWMRILMWVPPFSIGSGPLQYSAQNITTGELVLSQFITFLVTLVVVLFAGRIYRRAIFDNSGRSRWGRVFK